jgi:hypothetical protein
MRETLVILYQTSRNVDHSGTAVSTCIHKSDGFIFSLILFITFLITPQAVSTSTSTFRSGSDNKVHAGMDIRQKIVMNITPTYDNYYHVYQRKLWLFALNAIKIKTIKMNG